MATTETIGKRIERLRIGKGWSRPQLGREMATAIGRKPAFTGELIRLYEQGKNRPGSDARRALAKVFGQPEQYIEFGESGAQEAREPASARYASDLAPDVERLVRAFSWLTTEQQKKLLETLEADAATNKAIAKQLGPKFEFAKDERVLGILQQGGDFPPGKKRTAKAGKRRPPTFREEDPE